MKNTNYSHFMTTTTTELYTQLQHAPYIGVTNVRYSIQTWESQD